MEAFMRIRIRKNRVGFALIELMLVVVVMGVLAAVAIPMIGRLAQRADRNAREAAAQAARAEADAAREAEQAPVVLEGALPVYLSADADLSLGAVHRRLGMQVYTRFEAEYDGRFKVLGPQGPGAKTRLFIPFPEGTTEAWDVFLCFVEDGAEREPFGAVYERDGVHWTGILPAKTPVSVHVAYKARGNGRFRLALPPSRRTRDLRLRLELSGVPGRSVPDHALQPTSLDGETLVWDARNLVSDRSIIVDIPETISPMGRVGLLFKFVGLAILLFGAGFWYMTERYAPGRLDDFRWNHFILLASTYSLFFVCVAVLGYHGHLGTWAAMAVSAAVSLPLLVLHASRIVDRWFAMTRVGPLAAFTLGLVVNGVYGGPARDYLFLTALITAVAVLTVSSPVITVKPARRLCQLRFKSA